MANEIVRLIRGGEVVATTVADANGDFAFPLSAAGWPQGEARAFELDAQDTARGMLRSPSAAVELVAGPPNPIWSDDFQRADGAPGNGWQTGVIQVLAIEGGALRVTQPYGSYGVTRNPATGNLPADVAFRVTIPHAMAGRNVFGIAARVVDMGDGSFSGIQFFRAGSTWFGGDGELHAVWDLGVDPVTKAVTVTNGYPASWEVNQDHSLEIRVVGQRASLWIDGQEYGYFALAAAGAAGGMVALVGDAAADGGWTIPGVAAFPV